ncbi:methyl-accepting chemotaxis protein [Massilia sp. TWR1-2-2]|uniref:methyl-accepting chemotaxis protein n=1 Tax=Massilia sp. TWR1-2-2 TaxID=2804584 RepID=UPI003CE86FD4
MFFSKLTIGQRLCVVLGAILLLLVTVAVTGITGLAAMNTEIRTISDDRVPKIIAATDWLYRVMETARHTRNMLILDDAAKIAKEVDGVMEDKAARKKFMEELQATVQSPGGKAALQAVVDSRAKYTPAEDAYLKMIRDGDRVSAKAYLLGTMRPLQLDYIQSLLAFVNSQKKLIADASLKAADHYANNRTNLIAMTVVALLLGVAAALLLINSLLRQLGGEPAATAAIAERIANGELDFEITTRPGDQKSLLYSVKHMQQSLAGIVSTVRQGTDAISNGSSQIAAGNMDLSSRTEQQASSLEETASSMEEMASTVKQNAENARQANTLAVAASAVAGKGGEVVARVVNTMDDINASSRKIVDIISVIDGIAFQTNILALNAAVEAARAGEQGRGFAVVASEVRNLAQRSAAAAKEIKTLISDSVEKVDFGTRLVGEAGQTMDEIVDSIRRVTDIMNEISSASREQEAGISQIGDAINQMDTVTQQNAALVEEAAAAAQALLEQASSLSDAVSVFKVGAATGKPAPLAAAKPSRAPATSTARATRTSPLPARLRMASARGEAGDWESF